jgi:hypothetical protein
LPLVFLVSCLLFPELPVFLGIFSAFCRPSPRHGPACASASTPPQTQTPQHLQQHQQQQQRPGTSRQVWCQTQTQDTKKQRPTAATMNHEQQTAVTNNKLAKRGRSGGTSIERWLQTPTPQETKRRAKRRRPKQMTMARQ